MPDVQVRLGAIICDEDLAVLEGVHRARIHVQVGIELLHRYGESARPQQMTKAGRRQSLAERGRHTTGDEDVLGRLGGAREPGIYTGI
ncbi:hypothetical protein GCM10007170_27480 [Arthrobacter liuii]|uniref:Uncharacterized protein n=1 Tax=Arthrobacter liuii TaxID=1476996 RepID=A0ABQ2ATU7_9MICC|nr:hypothetical protein GCM10007170_27480 [Arthrobacter liuii]